MKIIVSTILLSIIFSVSFAQTDSIKLIKYDYDFSFNEGLYLDFNSFRNNSPIPYASFINPSYRNETFFEELDAATTITYNNKHGHSTTIEIIDIWGYSKNGKPYIYWANKYNLIPFVGQISHFITIVQVTHNTYREPFYDPYHYNPSARVYQSDELRQFLIDMETGEILDYNLANVEQILKRDPKIHSDFMELRKRKRKKEMFYYVKLYNEMNHLFIPNN